MGQSSTHDRMDFDHRDAVDVAVGPDSIEGRSLMEYLRKAKIPFLAFRGKIPNASTGAHIHIGRPSPRLMEVKHRENPSPVPDHRERTIELMSGGHQARVSNGRILRATLPCLYRPHDSRGSSV
jgi:hypothetical protein